MSVPVIYIVGPTGSGKTDSAIELARRIDGEVICADSRTVYRYLDIGTAKPSMSERQGIVHWGIDIANPDEKYTVATFKQYAVSAIENITGRGKVPIIVGGTGLYVDAVLFDYQFAENAEDFDNLVFAEKDNDELRRYCIENNVALPRDAHNKRRLLSAIRRNGAKASKREASDTCIVVGIATNNEILRNQIALRAEQIVADGVIEEASAVASLYGWGHESMTGNVYPIVKQYIENAISKEEVVAQLTRLDMKLVKRQLTWFRRNPVIEWSLREDVVDYVISRLSNFR